MRNKHFLKNNRPTLLWYKVHGFSRVKPKKRLLIPKAIRAIDYHKQLCEVLDSQYGTEMNFRLENDIENNVFVFTIPVWTGGWDRGTMDDLSAGGEVLFETEDAALSRLSPLPKIDWTRETRFKGKTIAEVMEKYCKYRLQKDERDYLNSWLRGYSKFEAGWKVRYESKNDYKFPIADVLEDLHSRKIPFRIEMLWDDGFRAILIKREISPSRVEVDNYNDKHQFLEAYELLEVPENDWIIKFHATEVEDAVRQMNYYVTYGKTNPKLSPEFLERKRKGIMKMMEEIMREDKRVNMLDNSDE
jgi:hypothetical protein